MNEKKDCSGERSSRKVTSGCEIFRIFITRPQHHDKAGCAAINHIDFANSLFGQSTTNSEYFVIF